MNEVTSVKEKLFRLFHAVEVNEFISLNSDFFSRKLLKHLFDEGAFKPNKYNRSNGKNDYNFMLDMFNMRNEPSENQKSKIRAIIVATIKPFLKEQLESEVKT